MVIDTSRPPSFDRLSERTGLLLRDRLMNCDVAASPVKLVRHPVIRKMNNAFFLVYLECASQIVDIMMT